MEPPMKKTIFHSRVFQLTVFLSSIFLLFVGSFLYKNVYRKHLFERQQTEFDRFLDDVFLDELESDAISLHFLIKDVSAYGLPTVSPVLSPYTSPAEEQYRELLLARRAALTSFSFEKLFTE